jgi:hypothetical protein
MFDEGSADNTAEEVLEGLQDLEPTEPLPTDVVVAGFFLALVKDQRVPAPVRLHAIRAYHDLTGLRGELFPEAEEGYEPDYQGEDD